MKQTATTQKNALSAYLDALKPDQVMVCSALLLSCVAALLELAPYLIIWRIGVEAFTASPEIKNIFFLTSSMLFVVLLRFAAQGGVTILGHLAAFRGECRLRHHLIDHVATLSPVWIEGRSGDLKRTIMEDVGRLNGFLAHTLPDLTSGLFLPLITSILLFLIDWRLALVTLALLPIGFIAQMRMAAGSRDAFTQWTAAEANAAAALLAYVRGIGTLKAFNRQAGTLEQVRQTIFTVRDLAVAITHRAALPYAAFATTLTYPLAIVLPCGLYFYSQHSLSLENLLFFLIISGILMLPLNKVILALNGLRGLQASGDRINALLAKTPLPQVPGSENIAHSRTVAVLFENTNYAVQTASGETIQILQNVSLSLPANSTTVMTGPSGAGKTTLARLLARLDDVTQGRILINGVDVRNISESDLGQLISIVFQDPILFHASIRDNIRLARPQASDEEIMRAIAAAGCESLIAGMLDGLDTIVGDKGGKLSGGEKQRIALARAFLKDAPLLILDEATAHVDPLIEHEIRQAMIRLMRNRTVLVIAHRLNLTENADQIVVMDNGKIETVGTHDRLLQTSGTYAKLWEIQKQALGWQLKRLPETLSPTPETQEIR